MTWSGSRLLGSEGPVVPRRALLWTGLLALATARTAFGKEPQARAAPHPTTPIPADPAILRTSRDSEVLLAMSLQLAQSDRPADHRLIGELLSNREFLNRLDSADDYRGPARDTRLAQVMTALARNSVGSARQTLAGLTEKPDFISVGPRQELLIQALVALRPPPPTAIRFWEQHSRADSVYRHVTMNALADNGSESALAVFERNLVDPKRDNEEVVGWIRDPLLRHRNEVAMLQLCERLVTRSLTPRLRPLVVEAVFDYRPDDWYRSEDPPQPPDRRRASQTAKDKLRQLGAIALRSVDLNPSQTRAVQKVLAELK